MRLLDIVHSVAVAARWAIAALGREHVHEVQEAHVAVAAGGVGAAVGLVIAGVEGRAQVGDLLAHVVSADGVVALVHESGVVALLGGGVVAETGGIVVVVGALDVGSRGAGVGEPAVGVGVGGPEGDFDAVGGGDVGEGGIALDELGAHGVGGDDDLVHVGEGIAVGEVVDDLVEDVEGGDAGAGGWVFVVVAVCPVGVIPDEGVC